ncbi:NDP-hexose 2,3-dehydratase family protein [Streptomyces sp. NPDC093984]|uniref:NDP-hexose 2,3-dehydratase family protein n=1 Tax=Streptomyces sp. NPDC093984 TaxID=3366052 RepID=UPI003804FCC5
MTLANGMATPSQAVGEARGSGPADGFWHVARPVTGPAGGLPEFRQWFAEQTRIHHYRVDRVPLSELSGWHFEDGSGDLVHESGGFFAISGLRVRTGFRRPREWTQPVIVQSEIGVLGILLKRFDGVPHLLMQAKMEPGNINTVQLSPTVQATRSNYTGVHRGRRVPYLEYFMGPHRGTVLADSLQSEQGWWFLHKRNRNMVVETREEVPLLDGFRWVTLPELGELLRSDNLVNMDSRTVLSTLPCGQPAPELVDAATDPYRRAALRSLAPRYGSVHSLQEVLRRLTDARSRHELVQRRVPLREVLDEGSWQRTERGIARPDGRHFEVVGVDVRAERREVGRWSQPLVAPVAGLSGLFVKRIDGVLHLLLEARVEAGTLNVCEYAPSVQCSPSHHAAGGGTELLGRLLSTPRDRIRYDAVQSEEGGRFHHAVTRNLVVEADDDFPLTEPEGHCWVTLHQAQELLRHSNYLNVQARTLVACLSLGLF